MSTEPLEPPEPLPFDGVVGTGVTGVCEGCATLIVTLELGVSVEPAVTLWLTMVPGISSSARDIFPVDLHVRKAHPRQVILRRRP